MHKSRTVFCLKYPQAQWWDPNVWQTAAHILQHWKLMMENQVHCCFLSFHSGLSGRPVVFFPFCLWWTRVEKMPCLLLCLCNTLPLQMGLCRNQPCSVNCQRCPVLRQERQIWFFFSLSTETAASLKASQDSRWTREKKMGFYRPAVERITLPLSCHAHCMGSFTPVQWCVHCPCFSLWCAEYPQQQTFSIF